MVRLGDNSNVALSGPSQNDLSRGFAVSIGNRIDSLVLENERSVVSTFLSHFKERLGAKSGVTGDGNALGLDVVDEGRLGKVGMVLNLQNRGSDASNSEEVTNKTSIEVGDANVLDEASINKRLESSPGLSNGNILELNDTLFDISEKTRGVSLSRVNVFLSNGEMNQKEIEVLKTPISKGALGKRDSMVLLMEGVPELGSDENVLTLDDAIGNGTADTFTAFLLVAVVLGTVNESVTSLNGVVDGVSTSGVRDFPGTETDKRHFLASGLKSDSRDVRHCCCMKSESGVN
jgi:hypothetical protein